MSYALYTMLGMLCACIKPAAHKKENDNHLHETDTF